MSRRKVEEAGRLVRWAVLAFATLAACPARADPSVTILPVGFPITEFRGPSSRVAAVAASSDAFREVRPGPAGPLVVVWGREGGAALVLAEGEVRVRPARRGFRDFGSLERGRGTIPDSRVAASGALTAQLDGPTRDYPHEALGSAIHAANLTVSERRPLPIGSEPRHVDSDVSRVAAGTDAVFEDREPHLADLNGDGTPEILVVRSYRGRGSALAVVGRRDGQWRIVAETPADGEPFRWLNPVTAGTPAGAAGSILLVRRPHLDGLLQLWRLAGDGLTLAAERPGYSNHAYGGSAQELAAALPAGPGGSVRLAIPTLDRRELAILVIGATIEESARIPLPARAATGLAVLGGGRDTHILVGLEDGRIADIRP